jgi:predicted MPP superfamily phosphohydrolase
MRFIRARNGMRRAIGQELRVAMRMHDVRIRGLDPRHDGLRVGHLSDLHVGLVTPDARIRHAVELLVAAQPDVCVLTGDFASRLRGSLRRLGSLVRGLPHPTVFVLGNHDHFVDPEAVSAALEGEGYQHLRNRWVELDIHGAPLRVIGLDDPVTQKHDPAAAVADIPGGGTRILASHLAESLDEMLELESVDLCLAGHTHGGQIYVPGLTRPLMRRLGHEHIRGLRRFRDGQDYPWVHVTHGVGSAVNPLRIGAAPEVAVLTLRGA